jgi:lipid II:glycine glycyltransferase (peptidoglycan interpeptide bridge formation enzyme)
MEPPILAEKMRGVGRDIVKVPEIQPAAIHTIEVDLTRPEDEIYASFRQRARREIRAGRKMGYVVQAQPIDDKNSGEMAKLFREMVRRSGLRKFARSPGYTKNFWREFAKTGNGFFFFVGQYNTPHRPIGGAFVCLSGGRALYKDGGSSRVSKHFSHLLQWQIMRWLKNRGVEKYDLGGVPPSDQADNPNHPYAGLLRFKSSFGAPIVDYVGTYDQVLRPERYRVWRRIRPVLRRALGKLPRRDVY